jgi:anti-sigma B factor antagonist
MIRNHKKFFVYRTGSQLGAGLGPSNGLERLRSLVEQMALSTEAVELDLSGVDYMDSSGVGGLVHVFKRLRGSRQAFHVIGLKGQPLQLLKRLQLAELIAAS